MILSYNSAGSDVNDMDFSLVKKAFDYGANYAIGIVGDGKCPDIADYLSDYFNYVQSNASSNSDSIYQDAFESLNLSDYLPTVFAAVSD